LIWELLHKAAAHREEDAAKFQAMYSSIKTYCDKLTKEFDVISDSRKKLLSKLSEYILTRKQNKQAINLVYICTHNSRRSHFGQIWAKLASDYYGINDVHTYSGGTEATAFNINAINSLNRIGFKISAVQVNENTEYKVSYDDAKEAIMCFSKVYDHPLNPQTNFAAVMTCSEADENCPFIPGVDLRIATTYDDPKAFDNKPLQDAKYDERCQQIALETFYVFSLVN
jgi:arsenate reductase (thioredoxin)